MVKSVQAEDSVAEHFDGLLKDRVAAEVGLLIGKPAVGSRDIVLAVVPNPDAEEVLSISAGGAAAAPKPKKGAAVKAGSSVSISLQHEELVDHALQVSRMLPGGLSVLGLYLFSPDSGFSSATPALCKALCSIAADLAALNGPTSSGPEVQQELLLLHIDSASKKFTMKSCLASSGEHAAAASLKPGEFKFGPSLASLVCLRAQHTFNLSLPATDSTIQLQQLLQEAVLQESARVLKGFAVIGGSIPANSTQPLADLLPASAGGVSGGGYSITEPAHVELYCSPAPAPPPEAAEQPHSTPVLGTCRLYGTVEAIAYVHRRDAAVKALSELQQDVCRSLTARLQLLQNEAADAAFHAQQAAAAKDGSANGSKSAAAAAAATVAAPVHPLLAEAGGAGRTSRGLLRRVLMPWAQLGGVQVCDYLMEGDTVDAAVDQARLLLHLAGLQPKQVEGVEAPAVLQQQAAVKAGGAKGPRSSSVGACGGAVMAAVAAGAAAVVGVALAYLNVSQ